VETYEDVGDIPVRVNRDLSAYAFDPDAGFLEKTKSPWRRALMMPSKMWTMLVTAPKRHFGHLAE
jgi:hypothetical protein